ncbi:hypothetical protein EV175_004120, partial [Coemansia sp. RSA 1933]
MDWLKTRSLAASVQGNSKNKGKGKRHSADTKYQSISATAKERRETRFVCRTNPAIQLQTVDAGKDGSSIDPMRVKLDLAGNIELAIDPSAAGDISATAANIEYIERMDEDDYGSDDDLGDTEATRAAKLRSSLHEELANFDNIQRAELVEADRKDYEANGEVLDQEVVAQRLQKLSSFGRHLRQIGRNRAGLLAQLANPLAEDHWMLDPAYHQRMVDALQSMSSIVNRLPEISEAARHCQSAPIPGTADRTDEANGDARTRQIAQMERLVHEVEQAIEWIENGRSSSSSSSSSSSNATSSILPAVSL